MARFVFALETLKKFRSDRLLTAKREMGFVEEKLLALNRSLRQVIDMRRELLSDHLLLGSYVDVANTKISKIGHEILAAEEELVRHKSWVTHLGRELKIVEKLEEKKRAEFEAEKLMKEKRASDNWVSDNWSRKVEAERLESLDEIGRETGT